MLFSPVGLEEIISPVIVFCSGGFANEGIDLQDR